MNREEFLRNLIERKYGNVKIFSENIDVPYTTIRTILEKGVGNARVDNVIKICKGLNIAPEKLSEDFVASEVVTDTMATMILLNQERQKNVENYTNQQYEEQNKVVPIEKFQQPKITEAKWDTTNEIDNKKVGYYTDNMEDVYAEVPELPSPAAGPGGDLHELIYDDRDITDYVLFPASRTPKNANYCFRVNGNSMESTFTDGQYAFVNTDVCVGNEEIGIFILNGEALLKKLITNTEDGNTHLVSLNPNYKDIVVTENDRFYIVGKVVM